MLTKKTFEDALHEAMRQKDELVKNTYKLLLSSIKMVEIDKGVPADENTILSILQKEIKMRKESISEFEKGGRDDLIKLAESEMAVLQKFLPVQMPVDQIKQAATAAVQEVNASQLSDMGKVMKILVPRLAGKAPADQISAIVRELLS